MQAARSRLQTSGHIVDIASAGRNQSGIRISVHQHRYGVGMYAKILRVTDGFEVPMLLVTSPDVEPLHSRGWFPWGSGVANDVGAALSIMPDLLTLSVDDVVVLSDAAGDPMSPPGWWERVSEIGDRVMIAVVPPGTPFNEEGLKAAQQTLLDSPATATALVPVVHR